MSFCLTFIILNSLYNYLHLYTFLDCEYKLVATSFYIFICDVYSSGFPRFLLSGNDMPDVKCLNLAGLSAVPGDAPNVAINAAKYTCHSLGGKGAMREFAEHILLQKEKAKSQKQYRIDRSSF